MANGIEDMETAYGETRVKLEQLNWEDVMLLSSKVANAVKSSSWKADAVVGISRGGIIPARIISDMLLVRDFYVYGSKILHRDQRKRRNKSCSKTGWKFQKQERPDCR